MESSCPRKRSVPPKRTKFSINAEKLHKFWPLNVIVVEVVNDGNQKLGKEPAWELNIQLGLTAKNPRLIVETFKRPNARCDVS